MAKAKEDLSREEIVARVDRAKQIIAEAKAIYDSTDDPAEKAQAETIIRKAYEHARPAATSLTGPQPPVEAPQSVVQQQMGQYLTPETFPQMTAQGATEAVENPTPTDSILPPMPQDSPYANRESMMDTVKNEILYPLNDKIGGVVQGFASLGSAEWADELYAAMNETIFGVDPEVSKEQYEAYRAGQEERNPAAVGLGQAAGVVAGSKALPSFSGVQSPFVQAGLQGGTYMGALEAGKAEDGKLAAGAKGFAGGFLFGGITQKVLQSGMVIADKVKNFKLKAALKRAEKTGTVASMKEAEKATYDAIPKNVTLFETGDDVISAIKQVRVDADDVYVAGSPANAEKVEQMITRAFEKNGGKLTPLQYKNLRTNLMSHVDDTAEGRVAGMMVAKFDDIAQQRMTATGNEILLEARKISSQVRKAEMFDDAFKAAKLEVGKLGQKSDSYLVYRNAAERILNSPQAKFLSDSERKLVENFIVGNNAFQKAEGVLASLSPSSSNFWAMAHVGGAIATGNPLMLLTMAVTEGGRMNLNRTTIQEAEKLVKRLGGLEVVQKNLNNAEFIRSVAVLGLDMDGMLEILTKPSEADKSKLPEDFR